MSLFYYKLYLKPGMEQTESHGTEKIGLKHGNGIWFIFI